MIKNAYFCVQKQQLLNPTAGFYFLQLGDDHLELNFSEVRCGTHQHNVVIFEVGNKEASAMDWHEIFGHRHDWDCGHQRLKYKNDYTDDHVNPRSWIGDICLELTWLAGKSRAKAALTVAGIRMDFDTLFQQPGLDMLCVNGDKKYPAVAIDKDHQFWM